MAHSHAPSEPLAAPCTPGAAAHKHTHDHAAHDHRGHAHHAHGADASQQRVLIAGLVTAAFMLVEVVGAVLSGSLALLADAAHMLTDAGSLALAWIGFRLARRPADARRSFGWARMKILAAFTNGILLILLAVWIVWEAVQRLMQPQPVLGGLLLIIAAAGLVVNLIAFFILHGGDKHDLNLRGAIWHVLGDLIGSAAAIIAAIVILTTGWMPADPLLSIVVAGIVAFAGVRIARESGNILMEGVPEGLDLVAVRTDLVANVPGLADARHIHAWTLTETAPLITLEALAAPGACPETLRRAVKARLAEAFHLPHATVEIVSEPLPGLTQTGEI